MKSTLFLVPLLWLCTPLMNTGTDAQKKPVQSQGHQSFRLFNPDTMAKPTAGYSQVAEVTEGKTIYVAGQVAMDASGTLVGKDDFRAQVDQAFKNINAAVQAAGGDFHSVIKLTYFCAESVDAAQIPSLREIRDKYVDTAHPPTSTLVVVKRLARPEWLIEIEAVAVAKK
jgi:enamine deaminase RidA (YjgF/YER057c/UK114 family)